MFSGSKTAKSFFFSLSILSAPRLALKLTPNIINSIDIIITSKGCFNEKGIKQTHGVVLSQLKFLAQL